MNAFEQKVKTHWSQNSIIYKEFREKFNKIPIKVLGKEKWNFIQDFKNLPNDLEISRLENDAKSLIRLYRPFKNIENIISKVFEILNLNNEKVKLYSENILLFLYDKTWEIEQKRIKEKNRLLNFFKEEFILSSKSPDIALKKYRKWILNISTHFFVKLELRIRLNVEHPECGLLLRTFLAYYDSNNCEFNKLFNELKNSYTEQIIKIYQAGSSWMNFLNSQAIKLKTKTNKYINDEITGLVDEMIANEIHSFTQEPNKVLNETIVRKHFNKLNKDFKNKIILEGHRYHKKHDSLYTTNKKSLFEHIVFGTDAEDEIGKTKQLQDDYDVIKIERNEDYKKKCYEVYKQELSNLPEEHRKIYILNREKKIPQKQIGRQLNKSEDQIFRIIKKVQSHLLESLKEKGFNSLT